MADETTSTWDDLLREAKGPLVEALRYKTVLLSEVKRDKNPRRWHGKQVTVPIFLSPQQGTSMITETGTLTSPVVVDTDQAVINSAIIALAISFSTQVMRQAAGDENSWAEVLPTKMERAEAVFGRVINEQFCGTGALLASATTGSTGTTVTVGTSANFYQLYPGRVVDILTRSTGAAPTGGAGRKITDISRSAGTVTIDQAVAVTTAEGIYIQGSYGNALQGLGDAVATTGEFEGINKANVDAWRGTDITPNSPDDLDMTYLDLAERRSMERSGSQPNFYLASPGVVDKYSQGLLTYSRWDGTAGKLDTGWTGVEYRNKLLIPEYDMPANTVYGVALEDLAIYTLDDGPDWDDLTGSKFQRFGTRSLPVESWLVWMLQLGFHRCNSFVKIGNMSEA